MKTFITGDEIDAIKYALSQLKQMIHEPYVTDDEHTYNRYIETIKTLEQIIKRNK